MVIKFDKIRWLPLLALMPVGLYANAIIPYLWVPFNQMVLFPVIVLIESAIVHFRLRIGYPKTLWIVLLANLLSTAIGALLYFALMPLVGKSLWNLWIEYNTTAAIGLSFSFALILLIISLWSELLVAKKLLKGVSDKTLTMALVYANIVTYAALLSFSIIIEMG